MSLERNLYPRDFKRWHDIRIDEFSTVKAVQDEAARKVLYDNFKQVALKYLSLQYDKEKSPFLVVIAKSPADLIKEGKFLHHCVGHMGYEQKMLRGESLIFFVRSKVAPDTPLATVEYSLLQRALLQCRAFNNSVPNDDVLKFVNDFWLPYANRKLKAA